MHEEDSLSEPDVMGNLDAKEGSLNAPDDACHEGDVRAVRRLP
jgi:hypothetical protein